MMSWRRMVPLLVACAALCASGCLGKPEIEDRWTRIDIASASVAPYQNMVPGAAELISVRAAITYRSILTGFAVAELRVSSVDPATVVLEPTANRVRMANEIDLILRNSRSVGRATRAVTGWDHLIQHIDFNFVGVTPAVLDSTGAPAGLFLVCYLGSGVEIERADGTDSLVVTSFASQQYELLPVGLELNAAVAP